MRNLALVLGCFTLASTCLGQVTNWVQVNTQNSPSARVRHGTAYDLIRGRTVIFGGTGTNTTFMNDTWVYDGQDWTQMQPKTVPPARTLTSMSFHLARVGTVMFGGSASTGVLNDTWVWNGQDWTQMNPKNSPPARSSHGMAYDSARQRTVLFGGNGGAGFYSDTWEWDGVDWTQVKTTTVPSARNANLAYDAARQRIVLFSGWPGPTTDTWEYDGKNWMLMKPAAQPSGRCCVGLAYDSARQRTVMFGGWQGFLQETWEYDGNTWVQMNPATKPTGRMDYDLMAYDVRRSRMVLFGGWGATISRLQDTWEYVASQPLTGSPSTVSIATGGTQTLSLNAGTQHGGRLYWVFGSLTGTMPGVTLTSAVGSVTIPLTPDFWTNITIALPNTATLANTKATLDGTGNAQASFNIPRVTDPKAIGIAFHHAYLVYDANNNFYLASNPVTLTLVK